MSNRDTERIEDRAYCQLGLLNVTMALAYGEREKAMVRLEQAIREEAARAAAHQHSPIVQYDGSETGWDTASDYSWDSDTSMRFKYIRRALRMWAIKRIRKLGY